MKSAWKTNRRREVRQTLSRYLAMMAIIALGVGFFAGLKVTRSAMVKTGDSYVAACNLYDYRLISTLGLVERDVQHFASLAGVEYAEGAITRDFITATDDGILQVLRAHSITENINCLSITAGRMPRAANECVADASSFRSDDIGTTIELAPANDSATFDAFAYDRYTVVGLANSVTYLNLERGTTKLAGGALAGFVYIPAEGFSLDYYTEVYIALANRDALFSMEYESAVATQEPIISAALEQQAASRYRSVVDEANQEIAEAEQEYTRGLSEYLANRTDAEAELADAWAALVDAKQELADGWAELAKQEADGRAELATAEQDLAEALVKLQDGETKYSEGVQDYQDGLAEYQSGLAEFERGREELADARRQLNAAQSSLDGASAQLQSYRAQYADLQTLYSSVVASASACGYAEPGDFVDAIDSGSGSYNAPVYNGMLLTLQSSGYTAEAAAAYLSGVVSAWRTAETNLGTELTSAYLTGLGQQITDGQAAYDMGLASYLAGRDQYQAAKRTMDEYEAELAAAEVTLEDAAAEIADSRQTLGDGWTEYNDGLVELADGRATLEQEVADARARLEDGEQEYADGLVEYTDALADANRQFADGEAELSSARAEIAQAKADVAELEPPTCYTLDRTANVGYACFESDSSVVEGVAQVFPVFFFLVAALVCTTTMDRMVEEQRTQIGTLKALGYSDRQVLWKYVSYAGSAAVIGCLLGFFGGSKLFPWAIWKAYSLLYGFGEIELVYDWRLAAVSLVAALLCSAGATYAVCRAELLQSPAALMRPKAPAAGKRILLERIPFLWRRLSFLRKVSIRNIFRYKKRLFMMVLGIGGCTAMVLTGFGIRDSIGNIVDDQFYRIMKYDYNISFAEAKTAAERQAFVADTSALLSQCVFICRDTLEVVCAGGTKPANVVATDDPGITALVDLHQGETRVAYPTNGNVVISEKLARLARAAVGDEVTVRLDETTERTFTVSGIFENYIYNYLYMTTATYEQALGEACAFSDALAVANGADVHMVASELQNDHGAASVAVIADTRDRFDRMITSLDSIVLLVLVCAAALAFVVLFNLSDINITERVREIATIKVLGFYPSEVGAYVFRENIVLTAIGALFGLPLGISLHRFVMSQIQVDFVSFRVNILPQSYLFSLGMTFGLTFVVDLVLRRTLARIDMAESMKSVE